jgi:hypothetical protein
MMPKVFLTKSFLIWLYNFRNQVPTKIPREKRIWQSFLDNLIFGGCLLYVDIDESFIEKCFAIVNGSEKAKDEEEGILAQSIYEYGVKNKIRSCKSEIEIFKKKCYSEYDLLGHKPDFLFLSDGYADSLCKEIADEFGVFCTNTKLNISTQAIAAQYTNIEVNSGFYGKKAFPFLPPINSVIILDQYLFNNDANGDYIMDLIKDLKIEKKIQLKFEGVKIVFIKLGRFHDAHDRHIFTNNYILTSGIGFKGKYSNGTTRIDYSPNISYFLVNKQTLKVKVVGLNLDNRLAKSFVV